MKKQLLPMLMAAALLSASDIKAQNWLLGGQNVPTTGGIIGTNNNRTVIFKTNNTERARILNSGLWGFGTNTPAAQVHINTSVKDTNAFRVDVLNAAALIVTGDGSTGLGTTTPFAKLHINSLSGELGLLIQSEGITQLLTSPGGGLSVGSENTPPDNGLFVSGNTGIGSLQPVTKLHVEGGSDASPGGGGFIVNGSITGTNLVADDNEIMARNNGVASTLTLNNNGGNVIIDGTKTGSRFALGTASPAVDMHIVHGISSGATNGLRLRNQGVNNEDWTFYIQNGNGILELYANNVLMGTFDDVSGNYFSISDLRRKKDIEKSPDLMDKILQLDVKKYRFAESKSTDKKYYGLIAQEVEKIFPEVVSHHKGDNGDEYYTMDYSSFGVLAVKAIQEQQNKITSLEDRLAKLEAVVASSNAYSAFAGNIQTEINNAVLEQNHPNPFNQTTTIKYTIPQGAKGQINIFDAEGNPVKSLQAAQSGQMQVNASDLKAGVYTYNLLVNGKIAASKKMVIAR